MHRWVNDNLHFSLFFEVCCTETIIFMNEVRVQFVFNCVEY